MPRLPRPATLIPCLLLRLLSGCAGADDWAGEAAPLEDWSSPLSAPAAGPSGAEADLTEPCDPGTVHACTVWLGAHGDLSNCAPGLALCTGAAYGPCFAESELAQDPNLLAAWLEAAEAR